LTALWRRVSGSLFRLKTNEIEKVPAERRKETKAPFGKNSFLSWEEVKIKMFREIFNKISF
jgi:hypothetical protein